MMTQFHIESEIQLKFNFTPIRKILGVFELNT